MYNWYELKDLEIKPKINDITLEVLRQFYENYLYPFVYNYTIEYSDRSQKDIELRFDTENFCHLLGVETVVKNAVSQKNIQNYKGDKGWENVKNGIIDISLLKTLNKSKFQSVKAKYVYFYLLPNLITKPLAVKYEKDNVNPPTSIESELLFYSQVTGDSAIIHLGLEKKENDTYYIPRTFFVEKVNDACDDIYIKKQETITVNVTKRVILQQEIE